MTSRRTLPSCLLAVLTLLGCASTHADAPRVGQPAPPFALKDQNGTLHRLADYVGKWLVVYFYPKDDTPGCTKEACHFRDDIAGQRREPRALREKIQPAVSPAG